MNGLSLFYIIKDKQNNILGRINLTDIDYNKKTANLGYRIGSNYIGKGIAYKTLNLLIKGIDASKIEVLNVKATTSNIGSQKVMTKNNFILMFEDKNYFELNGKKENFLHYKLHLKSRS
ncbi:GNAT family N-acetyltransferase [Peptostreptococcaceae bacterium OttesenSCG-928-C18]|nr:GNAT family N-acetyltransferase [Peptostreptococcaceae bacterium OttesenSCG-928-C18]